jgi:HEAT repeat protein
MPVTMEEVRAALDPEEPDYVRAAQLGPDALPHLEVLAQSSDPLLASKAVYLASLIPDNRAVMILKEATQSNEPQVRIAAATGASNLVSPEGGEVLLSLLDDQDVGVRKVALNSVPINASPRLHRKIEDLATTDSEAAIRTLSNEVLNRLPPMP